MQLTGIRGQEGRDFFYDMSGTITTGGTAQLLLPEQIGRSFLMIQNISDTAMYLEFGSARATATLTSGVVTSCSVTNAGQGFTIAPIIQFLGGGNVGGPTGNSTFVGSTEPGAKSPQKPAEAHCVLSTGTVGSIVVDYGGALYKVAPYVFISNSLNDPNGVATASATSGIELMPAGSITFSGTSCPTDPISIFCATTAKAFTCKFMI